MLRTVPHVLEGVRTSLGGGSVGKQGALAWEGRVGWKGGLWEDGIWEGAETALMGSERLAGNAAGLGPGGSVGLWQL